VYGGYPGYLGYGGYAGLGYGGLGLAGLNGLGYGGLGYPYNGLMMGNGLVGGNAYNNYLLRRSLNMVPTTVTATTETV